MYRLAKRWLPAVRAVPTANNHADRVADVHVVPAWDRRARRLGSIAERRYVPPTVMTEDLFAHAWARLDRAAQLAQQMVAGYLAECDARRTDAVRHPRRATRRAVWSDTEPAHRSTPSELAGHDFPWHGPGKAR